MNSLSLLDPCLPLMEQCVQLYRRIKVNPSAWGPEARRARSGANWTNGHWNATNSEYQSGEEDWNNWWHDSCIKDKDDKSGRGTTANPALSLSQHSKRDKVVQANHRSSRKFCCALKWTWNGCWPGSLFQWTVDDNGKRLSCSHTCIWHILIFLLKRYHTRGSETGTYRLPYRTKSKLKPGLEHLPWSDFSHRMKTDLTDYLAMKVRCTTEIRKRTSNSFCIWTFTKQQQSRNKGQRPWGSSHPDDFPCCIGISPEPTRIAACNLLTRHRSTSK